MFRPREGYLQVFSVAHSEVQAGEFCVVWLRPLGTHEWSALKCGIQLTFIQSVWYCACPERLRGSKNGFLQLLDIWLFEQEIVWGHTFVGFNEPGGSCAFIIGTVKCSSISRVKLSTQCLELRFYTLNKWNEWQRCIQCFMFVGLMWQSWSFLSRLAHWPFCCEISAVKKFTTFEHLVSVI